MLTKRAVTTIILENQEKSLKEDRAFLSENAPTNSSFGGNASMDNLGSDFNIPCLDVQCQT